MIVSDKKTTKLWDTFNSLHIFLNTKKVILTLIVFTLTIAVTSLLELLTLYFRDGHYLFLFSFVLAIYGKNKIIYHIKFFRAYVKLQLT